jgi:hypothetical protein
VENGGGVGEVHAKHALVCEPLNISEGGVCLLL